MDTSSRKREVYLETFSLEDGDEGGIITAARIAIAKSYMLAVASEADDGSYPSSLDLLLIIDSLINAAKCGSNDFVFNVEQDIREKVFRSFVTSHFTSILLSRKVTIL